MPTAATRARDHQKQWQEIVSDSLLSELPYKVETNHRGQIILSPHKNRHTFQQKAVEKKLDELRSDGEAFQNLAIATGIQDLEKPRQGLERAVLIRFGGYSAALHAG